MKRIPDLPLAKGLPEDNEYVVPICIDHTTFAVHKISIKEIADRITDLVLKGDEVEMVITENGIKFNKRSIGNGNVNKRNIT